MLDLILYFISIIIFSIFSCQSWK